MKVKQFYVINTNSYKVRFCYRREARSPVGLKANKERKNNYIKWLADRDIALEVRYCSGLVRFLVGIFHAGFACYGCFRNSSGRLVL